MRLYGEITLFHSTTSICTKTKTPRFLGNLCSPLSQRITRWPKIPRTLSARLRLKNSVQSRRRLHILQAKWLEIIAEKQGCILWLLPSWLFFRRRTQERYLKMSAFFSIFPGHLGCKTKTNYPGITLVWAIWRIKIFKWFVNKLCQQNCKTGHFTSWKERKRKRKYIKNASARRANMLFFIVKYANAWRSSCCRHRSCSKINYLD